MHCCEDLRTHVEMKCSQGSDSTLCSDKVLKYSAKFDEYGIIIHDGGNSYYEISFCPFCGSKLPQSKRDEWFDKLEKLGFNDPFDENIPEEFTNDRWWSKTDTRNW